MAQVYTPQALTAILGHWWHDPAAATVELRPSSGLSGALIWRVTHYDKDYCLRRWPYEQHRPEELVAIHGLLRHVIQRGIDFVPAPLGYVEADGHLWELTQWMPGEPYNRSLPNRPRMLEAMRRVAQFHRAAASYETPKVGHSPGLVTRRRILQQLRDGGLIELSKAVAANPAREWKDFTDPMLNEVTQSLANVLRRVESLAKLPLPLQWCQRDAKYDHVLFQGDRLTGLIDFGAAAIDSVAGDVARLVGTMVGNERDDWALAVDSYQEFRPLSADERRAIQAFDQGGTIVAATNWLTWLLVEKRQFANNAAVRGQLEWLHTRLRALT